MESKNVSVDGILMRWEESGDGLPLVLLHGIPTSPLLWQKVMPRIRGARCLAWEMVGYGQSIPQGIDRNISVARQAGYLVSWLNKLNIERAVLAGHDLGGGVAQIAAVSHPGLCLGLFLTNAIGYDSWPIPSVKAMQTLGPAIQHLPDALFKQVLRSFLYRGHDDADEAKAAFEKYWPNYAGRGGAAAFIRQVKALRTSDTLSVAGQLPELDVPARIVWGESDAFQKIEYGERFSRDLGAPLRRIPGGKHFTPEDHPDVVAEEINSLVAEVATRAPITS